MLHALDRDPYELLLILVPMLFHFFENRNIVKILLFNILLIY